MALSVMGQSGVRMALPEGTRTERERKKEERNSVERKMETKVGKKSKL